MAQIPSWRTSRKEKQVYTFASYGIIGLIICAIVYLVVITGGGNPFTRMKMERLGREYLQANYPGVYERVQRMNSGKAVKKGDGWLISYYECTDYFSGYTNLRFSLLIYEDGTVREDGYRIDYASGATTYQLMSEEYNTHMWKLIKEYEKPDKAEALSPVEIDYVQAVDTGFYPHYFYYMQHYGLKLDPEQTYSFTDYAGEYGYVDITFGAKGEVSIDEYCATMEGFITLMEQTGTPWNSLHTVMYVNGNADIWRFETDITAAEAAESKLTDTIKRKTAIKTTTGDNG